MTVALTHQHVLLCRAIPDILAHGGNAKDLRSKFAGQPGNLQVRKREKETMPTHWLAMTEDDAFVKFQESYPTEKISLSIFKRYKLGMCGGW